jgi:TolB-like protein/DNA-binding winged helix-turn-helix (wHTH) protein/Tfp pilus assembly protein PilF
MHSTSGIRRATFADFSVDFESFELRKCGIRLRLQHQPFQVLKLLLERHGQLVTRDELRAQLWSESTFVDFDAGLNAAVRRLRDELHDSADTPRYIETIPRHGYRFFAPVEVVELRPPEVQEKSGSGSDNLALVGDLEASVPAKMHAPVRALAVERDTLPTVARSPRIWLLVSGVALCAVLLGASVFTRRGHHDRIYSIAVLPLQNLSGDPSQDYFADGMTDALITSLAQSNSLKVISSTSSMRYKGTGKRLADIAKELNVDVIVEGSVIRSGNHVNVTAQLLDAVKDQHLWAHRYVRDMQDVLQLQSDLASAIAKEVGGKLSPADESRLAARARPVNPDAYEAYLKGKYFLNKWTFEGFAKSKTYFEKAVEVDPGYVDGQVGLAEYYGTVAFTGMAPRENWSKSENLLEKALQMDSNSSKAHTLLGMIKFQFRCDQQTAETELNRALELDRADMSSLDYHSYYLLETGKTEQALAEKKIVLSHDPLSVITNAELGLYLVIAGRNEEAIIQLQKTLELDPNYAAAHTRLGMAYFGLGRYAEAAQAMEKGISLSREPGRVQRLGEVYARWGQRQKALQQIAELREMSKKGYAVSSAIAIIYAELGNKDAAFGWLTKVTPDEDPKIIDSGFDGIRSDPRFQTVQEHLKPDPRCPAF